MIMGNINFDDEGKMRVFKRKSNQSFKQLMLGTCPMILIGKLSPYYG